MEGKFCIVATGTGKNDISIIEPVEGWEPKVGEVVPALIARSGEKTVVTKVLDGDAARLAKIVFQLDEAAGGKGSLISTLHEFGVAWARATVKAIELFPSPTPENKL